MEVLYVDDYEPMGELVREVLEDEGFTVTVHTDPLEALRACLAPAVRFDAAVVDYNMPGIDGDEFCRRVIATLAVPVVIVSGQVDDARRAAAKDAGARAMIDKKVVVRELAPLLRTILGAP